jgi:hypothetical protein
MTDFYKYFYIMIIFLVFLSILACNTDLFNVPKAPNIEAMDVSAYTVDPGDTVQITIRVDDTDGVLHYEWSADGGEFIQPTDRAEVFWIAPLVGGQYRITVEVSNDEKSTKKTRTITVRSYTKPVVEILDPQNGDYLVQYSEIIIQVFAQHQNGINHLDFFINDTLKCIINGQLISTDYHFSYELSDFPGSVEMKIEAFANITETVGRDSIQVFIEGIVLGKNHLN